ALVDVVNAIQPRPGEEVLGEVHLHPGAHVGEGAAVPPATVGLADALMRHPGGQVRAQAGPRLTEVIDGVERRQTALDVLVAPTGGGDRVFRGEIMVFAMGNTQGNIVREEVAGPGPV